MPPLIRKAAIFAAVDGLILQPGHSKEHRSLQLDYRSQRIKEVDSFPHQDETSLDCHGIVGILTVAPHAHLIAISGRKQVAQIRGAPVYVITNVAIIPLSSQTEAASAIKQAKGMLRRDLVEDTESEGDSGDEGHQDNKSVASVGREEEQPRGWSIPGLGGGQGSGSTKKESRTVAQDVINKRGAYGRFTERWFSRNGWVSERRRAQGMSQDEKGAEESKPRPREPQDTPSDTDKAFVPSQQKDVSATSSSELPLSSSDRDFTSTFLPKLLRTTSLLLSSGNLYYSYDIDITRRLGQLSYSKNSDIPLHKLVDPTFFWNSHLLKNFVTRGHHAFALPIMQGFVGQRVFHLTKTLDNAVETVPDVLGTPDKSRETNTSPQPVSGGSDFLLTLISRRSIERPGLRYLRRGVDDEGHTANSVETEQVLSKTSWAMNEKIYSLSQYRGSIPLFFSQSPYSFKPIPTLQHSHEVNQAALERHFSALGKRYGELQVVSLVDTTGGEKAIGERYQNLVEELNGKVNSSGQKIGFEWFDFHNICRGMQFQNVSILMDTLSGRFEKLGQTVEVDGKLEAKQQGVIRTNCMDCLDRSNVVQSAFGQRALEVALKGEGFEVNLSTDTSTQWFNSLWADNGDAISKQYSSTAALKGDYTRTRKRNYRGAINDLVLTLSRYYNNVVNDYFSQAVIDYLLGNVNIRVFEDFEEKLMTSDPGMSMQKIRDNAINTSSKVVVADPEEDLINGWTLLSPQESDRIKSVPLEETVLLLTNAALYQVRFDWSNEKVSSFERVKLRSIARIFKGTYVTSTLTSAQCDESTNIGFVIGYRPGKDDITRVNTRSLSTAVGVEGSPLGPAENVEAEMSDKRKAENKTTEKILVFKALPAQSSVENSQDKVPDLSENQMIENICEEIRRVTIEEGGSLDGPELKDDNIVSLEEARKSTGYVEQWTHSIKRLVWG